MLAGWAPSRAIMGKNRSVAAVKVIFNFEEYQYLQDELV